MMSLLGRREDLVFDSLNVGLRGSSWSESISIGCFEEPGRYLGGGSSESESELASRCLGGGGGGGGV